MAVIPCSDGSTAVIVPAQPGQLAAVVWTFEEDDGVVSAEHQILPVIGYQVLFHSDGCRFEGYAEIIVPCPSACGNYTGLMLPGGSVYTPDGTFASVGEFVARAIEWEQRRADSRRRKAAAASATVEVPATITRTGALV